MKELKLFLWMFGISLVIVAAVVGAFAFCLWVVVEFIKWFVLLL